MDTDDIEDEGIIFIRKGFIVFICGLLQNGTGDVSILENAGAGRCHRAFFKNTFFREALD